MLHQHFPMHLTKPDFLRDSNVLPGSYLLLFQLIPLKWSLRLCIDSYCENFTPNNIDP